jgi:hypothetical protein
VNTPPARGGRDRREPRRAPRITIGVAAFAALCLPIAYMSGQLWTSAGDSQAFVATERVGVTYTRPLTKLLAGLVDAQSAAVRGAQVDVVGIRAQVEEVNRVDREPGDPLHLGPRWSQVASQVETALGQKVTGKEALRAYATPIALTQALLNKVGDVSKVLRDPGLDAYYLIDTVLRVPQVIVDAGQVAALAGPARSDDTQLAVAQDRINRSAQAISMGLRVAAGASTKDLNVLGTLDEFAAAADAMGQTARALNTPGSTARTEIDAAQRRLHIAALTLETAALNAFDSLLKQRATRYSDRRATTAFAGLLAALAAATLLWLRLPGAAVAHTRSGEARGEDTDDGDDYRAEPAAGSNEGDEVADLVDARQLLAPELVHVGRAVHAKRQESGDDR